MSLKQNPAADTQSLGAEGAGHPIQRFWLHVIDGPDAGLSYASRGSRATVGSHQGSDLVLGDRAVSRYHCEIEIDGNRAILRDLGSRNGTAVSGVTVREALLDHGAAIRLGHTTVRFERDAELIKTPISASTAFGRLVGGSPLMRQVFAVLERVRDGTAPVLLLGEPGTGKGTAALSLHEQGDRKAGPFVIVDCASGAADVAASLFGGEGAPPALEGAQGGTLFLEDIGLLSIEHQARLMRAIEAQSGPVARLISSSRSDLRAEVNAGRFRADLYYRLAVVVVRMPPLRERADDIPALASHLLGLGEEATAGLARLPWPGNVSELRNHLERAAALGQLARAPLSTGPRPEPGEVPLRVAREQALQEFERGYLERLLARAGNNVTAAARMAGVDRVHFYRLLWRYGLR